MPEADYLRLTAERLAAALSGSPLVRAELRWPNIAGANLEGRRLISAQSYGKHLLLRFDDARTLHIHLRMEGLFRIARTGTPAALGKSKAIRAVLATNTWTALGIELGMMDLLATADEKYLLKHLGPEILAPDFLDHGAIIAADKLSKYPDWPICAALLEQSIAAGIGTIWLAETLWTTQLYPWMKVAELAPEQRIELYRVAHKLLMRSVAVARVSGLGAAPRHAHGQHKRFCGRCGVSPIKVSALSGPQSSPDQGAFDRVVFWCPECQRKTGELPQPPIRQGF